MESNHDGPFLTVPQMFLADYAGRTFLIFTGVKWWPDLLALPAVI